MRMPNYNQNYRYSSTHTQSDFDKWVSVRQAAQMLYLLARTIGDVSWLFHPKQGVNAPPTPARTYDIITFQTLSRVL